MPCVVLVGCSFAKPSAVPLLWCLLSFAVVLWHVRNKRAYSKPALCVLCTTPNNCDLFTHAVGIWCCVHVVQSVPMVHSSCRLHAFPVIFRKVLPGVSDLLFFSHKIHETYRDFKCLLGFA